MPVEPKTISQAINETTEEDIDKAADEAEGAAAEGGEAEAEEKGEAEGEAEGEAAEGEAEGEAEEEEEEAEEEEEEEDEASAVEDLTPEQLAAIKANPEMNSLYKSLMRATTKKWQKAGEALRLVDSYQKDPIGVLQAIARANGYSISPAQAAAQAEQVDAVTTAAKKIESLFGEKVGPTVRAALDEYFTAVMGKNMAPLKSTLGRVVNQGEAARMMSEEQNFKMRHHEVLTPDIEKAVIALGESGKIVPGPNTTPTEYLDTLLEVVMSKRTVKDASRASKDAAKKLHDRINRNRSDREPTGVGAKAGVGKASGIKPGMSLSEAFDVAAKELDEEAG